MDELEHSYKFTRCFGACNAKTIVIIIRGNVHSMYIGRFVANVVYWWQRLGRPGWYVDGGALPSDVQPALTSQDKCLKS